jgi:hypothetical protein
LSEHLGDTDPETPPAELATTGVGDPVLQLDYIVMSRPGIRDSLGLFAAVKAPVADVDTTYGTGEWDTGAGVGYFYPLAKTGVYAEASYWLLGDPPGLELLDPMRLRVEVVRRLGSRWRGALAVDGSTEVVEGAGESVVLEASALRSVSPTAETGVFLAVGLTSGAPDIVLSWEWRLGS